MFFKRKPKPPLMTAIDVVNEAIQIAYIYQHDRKYMPSKEDLQLFKRFAETLFRNYSTMERICRNLHQRSRGEPEGAPRFTNPSHPWT
jgi:hypothetical protein